MHRYDRRRQGLALGMAFLAGTVDANGFLVARGYFTSFMSGNTTRLGVDLAREPQMASLPVTILGCFVVGVTAGALIARKQNGRHKRILLAVVAAFLSLAAIASLFGHDLWFLALATTAMGFANNVFSRDGEVTVGVTYMTGALVRFAQGLAARIAGQPDRTMRGYGWLWCSLALGAAFGAFLHLRDAQLAVCSPVAITVALLLVALVVETRSASDRAG